MQECIGIKPTDILSRNKLKFLGSNLLSHPREASAVNIGSLVLGGGWQRKNGMGYAMRARFRLPFEVYLDVIFRDEILHKRDFKARLEGPPHSLDE